MMTGHSWRRTLLTTVGVLCATVMAVPATATAASPASAGGDRVTPVAASVVQPLATHLSFDTVKVTNPDGESVTFFWGFDYNPADNDLRAWAQANVSPASIHTQADALNLGDRNGVLKTATINSQSGGFVLETAAVSCHRPDGFYNSDLHYSIRWADGSLDSGASTGDADIHDASVICT